VPCDRIEIVLAFECDDKGSCADPRAQGPVDALKAAIAAARPFSCWLSESEDGTVAKSHLCGHSDGRPCPEPTTIGVKPAKRVAAASVAAEPKPVEK
jgi:hypothetical protein